MRYRVLAVALVILSLVSIKAHASKGYEYQDRYLELRKLARSYEGNAVAFIEDEIYWTYNTENSVVVGDAEDYEGELEVVTEPYTHSTSGYRFDYYYNENLDVIVQYTTAIYKGDRVYLTVMYSDEGVCDINKEVYD